MKQLTICDQCKNIISSLTKNSDITYTCGRTISDCFIYQIFEGRIRSARMEKQMQHIFSSNSRHIDFIFDKDEYDKNKGYGSWDDLAMKINCTKESAITEIFNVIKKSEYACLLG